MKRIKRQWARVRFNPEAKLRHQAALQRSRPVMYYEKGSLEPGTVVKMHPSYAPPQWLLDE